MNGITNQNRQIVTWAEFLERIPPSVTVEIADLVKRNYSNQEEFSNPDIHLYCDSDKCKGLRFFKCEYPGVTNSTYTQEVFLTYRCRNCGSSPKTYAVSLRRISSDDVIGIATKFGESPVFGPPVPSRVISLIGPDREIFLQGRRCENQGLGIGAFAYYRRVVENQKGRLIYEVAKVAKRLGATAEVLKKFERAATETQFSKAIDDIKTAIPQILLIEGHNPLLLLHSALSEGLHARKDEECLEMATSIRVVLTELAERISQALKDEAELKQAVGNLLRRNQSEPGTDSGLP